tara:strand:- start:9239 stop:10105 length:867 start_codon:yes stop_codon:yes gene_type:complete
MTIPFYIVDVFTKKKYAGNQLAVFLNATDLTSDQMQEIASEINFAESTFVTGITADNNKATIRIFTPAHEMQFAGHPIIGTSWVLMNKVFKHQPKGIKINVPIGEIPVSQSQDLVWLKAAQPDFLDVFMKDDFASFSNLSMTDFDDRFVVQEVTTGSAFVMVPLKDKETLNAVKLDKDKTAEWLKAKCKTEHRALYFFSLENEVLTSRMLCIENNQLIEDAATGSASTCLQAFLLKYHTNEISVANNQGECINRSSQIYFEGKREESLFDINIGGETQFVAQGEWEVV